MKILGILFAMFFVVAQTVWADTAVIGVDENGQLENVIVIKGKTFDKEIPKDASRRAMENVKTVELLASDGAVICKTIVPGEMFLTTDDFSKKNEPKNTFTKVKSFAVIVNWTDKASSIRISEGKSPVNVLKIAKNKIEYRQVETQLATRGAGGGYGTLDLLFLGSGYSGQTSLFNNKANNLKSFLKNRYSGYNYYTSFQKYNPNSTLGCVAYGTCNQSQVLAAAQQSGYNYDEIFILIRSDLFYGASYFAIYDYQTTPWVTFSWATDNPRLYDYRQGGMHELGHSFGALADEYLYSYNNEYQAARVNCRPANGLCPGLGSLYTTFGCNHCYTTCKKPDNNIMRSLPAPEYYSHVAIYANTCYPDGLDRRMLWFRTH